MYGVRTKHKYVIQKKKYKKNENKPDFHRVPPRAQ